MSKRFTETGKWADSWFRKLPPVYKAFWLYLVDNCDVAGVWDADLELAEFQIGEAIDFNSVKELFGERVTILPNGRWFLVKFVSYQYGKLNPSNPCHKAVFKSLEINSIEYPFKAHVEDQGRGSEGPCKDLQRGINAPQDKDKDKDKDKYQEEGCGEKQAERRNRDQSVVGPQLPDWMPLELKIAFGQWEDHLAEKDQRPTRMTRLTWYQECQRYGIPKAIAAIQFSISKGAKSLLWDGEINRFGGQSAPAGPPKPQRPTKGGW